MFEGSCLCGLVKYRLTSEPGPFGYCHCVSCQKASGTAHAANAPVDRGAFQLIQGQSVIKEFESSPGKFRAFCTNCGSPLYAYLSATREVLRIRLGSLDTPFFGQPQAHTWISEKAHWEPVDDDLPKFSRWASRAVLDQRGTRQD